MSAPGSVEISRKGRFLGTRETATTTTHSSFGFFAKGPCLAFLSTIITFEKLFTYLCRKIFNSSRSIQRKQNLLSFLALLLLYTSS